VLRRASRGLGQSRPESFQGEDHDEAHHRRTTRTTADQRPAVPRKRKLRPTTRGQVVHPDAGATWLLTEIDPDDHDHAFGLCDLGQGFPELGYVSLAELQSVRGRLGLAVERDLHFIATKSISAYAREARLAERIVA
jgi:hypothetical protein